MTDNQDCLAEYVRTGSDAAFGELVTRYVDLVYSTALRLVGGDMHRAEDVAQTVFANLARVARALPKDVKLGGWLHRDTCFTASTLMRGERRRQAREKEAVEMNVQTTAAADYSLVAPVLDEAINQLGEEDRIAILLRFFEQNNFRSVGAALGSNEDAARMRVTRALEKLESYLKRRGITTTAASLGVALSTNAVQAAPVGLALTITTAAALTGTALATTATVTATKAIAMTALQKTIVTVTIAVLAGVGIYEARQASQLREQVQTLQQQQAPLDAQLQQLQSDLNSATNRLATLRDDNERLSLSTADLLKLRGEVSRLRQEHSISPGVQTPGQTPASGFLAKDRLISSVFDTPEAGLQSFMKAFISGSYDEALAAMSPELKAFQKERFGELSDEDKKQYAEEAGRFQGMQIIAKKIISDDKVELEVLMFENGRAPYVEIRGMSKAGNEWKFNNSTKEVESWGKDGHIQFLMPSGK